MKGNHSRVYGNKLGSWALHILVDKKIQEFGPEAGLTLTLYPLQ